VIAGGLGHHLAVYVGGNAAHLVVDGGHHWNGLAGDVDIGEVVADLVDRRQALHDGFCAQVVEL